MSLSIGFDPEVSVHRDKVFLPAWAITKGEKSKPEIINDMRGVGVLWDGVSLEINTKSIHNVVTTAEVVDAWIEDYETVLEWTSSKNVGVGVYAAVSAYGKDVLADPRAGVYGCSEDFDAYGAMPTAPRVLAFQPADGLKCFGGHIHIGYDIRLCPPHNFVRMMDLFWAAAAGERQGARRQRYGLPGLFRPKPYGVEYRTPSNLWVTSIDRLRALVSSAILINTLLNESHQELIGLYRSTNWDRVKAAVTTENNKNGNKLCRDALARVASFNPRAYERYMEDGGAANGATPTRNTRELGEVE